MEFFQIYWPVFLVALVVGIIVGLRVLRPKQNVRLTDSVPLRPHMNVESQPHEGRSLADEAAAAASDIAGPILGAGIHAELQKSRTSRYRNVCRLWCLGMDSRFRGNDVG